MPPLSENTKRTQETFKKDLMKALAGWVTGVSRCARWIILLACLLTVASLYYTATHLGMNTDTADMLSEEVPFRRYYDAFIQAFPQFDDALLVVIDGKTPELAQDAAAALSQALARNTELFEHVYAPGADPFFQKNGFLYLSLPELEVLSDNMARIQPFLGQLARDLSLRGLFGMLNMALEATQTGEALDLSQAFNQIHPVIRASQNEAFYPLSWQELMQGQEDARDLRRHFIIARPRLDYASLLPAQAPLSFARHQVQQLELTEAHGVRVRFTGDAALEYEEMLSVSRGAVTAGILAFICVGIVLFVGLGSPRLVAATLMTLVIGLSWTAWFASVAVGHLNLISVAFAVLYIGLSVDYGIHFCLRYKELIQRSHHHTDALRQTAQDIGSSLIFCTLSTAIGFYAFIPTVFKGIAELGIISGTGMVISLISNLTLLPALLTLMPIAPGAPNSRQPMSHIGGHLLSFPIRHARAIRLTAYGMGIGSLLLVTQARFDNNPMNLRDPASESVTTLKELLSQSETPPWTLTILTPNAKSAQQFADQLTALDEVNMCVTLNSFVPSEQDEKLMLIEEMGLLLGPELFMAETSPPPDVDEQIAVIQRFIGNLVRYSQSTADDPQSASARLLQQSLASFLTLLVDKPPETKARLLHRLQENLLHSFPGRMKALEASLEAEAFASEDLPPDLTARWRSPNQIYRAEVFPAQDLNNTDASRQFVHAVRTIAPEAIGLPVIYLDAGNAVVSAFQKAFMLALVAITTLLFFLLKPKSDVLLIIFPLLLAGLLTGAASVVLNIPFNFANIIALPLLLGIGVDNGIHMVHRMRTAPPADGHILTTSTARAVLFSSLTTISSFGNLAFSPHRGMASMGIMLTLGIGFALFCTLIILPAFLEAYIHTSEK